MSSLLKSFSRGLAFAAGLLTTTVLAVTLGGTLTEFTGRTVVSASAINANFTLLKNAIEGIPECSEYSVRVTQSATQNIPDSGGGNTFITWDVETFDAQNMHSNTTNNTRLTIPLAGRYLVSARLSFNINATGGRSIYLHRNGAFYSITDHRAGANGRTTIQLVEIMDLAAGEYLEVAGSQDSGATLTTSPTNGDYFSAVRLCGN